MKRQGIHLFFIHLLLFVVTANLVAIHEAIAERSEVVWGNQTTERSEQVEVISILGYVEVRRNGENYWEAAKKNMKLYPEDLVRIPPKATLRVRLEGGDAVYFVPGQENLIKDLVPAEKRRVIDGRTRSSKAEDKSSQQIWQTRQSGAKKEAPSMINQHIEFLYSMLEKDANNNFIKEFAQSVVKNISITENTGYPNRDIACAQYLFDALRKRIKFSDNEPPAILDIQPPATTLETRQGNNLGFVRLYLALLNAVGVDANPQGDGDIPLFIAFNSGIPNEEAQSITVNKKLYFVENDIIWLPIQITPSTDNFIKAWYKGSEIYLK